MNYPICEEKYLNKNVKNDSYSINFLLYELTKKYPQDNGWIMEKPIITQNFDKKTVTIEIIFRQYKIQKKGCSR